MRIGGIGHGGRGPTRLPRYGDEVKAEKEFNPGLEAKTLFEEMQRRYPGKFSDGQLRTLQRCVWQLNSAHFGSLFWPTLFADG